MKDRIKEIRKALGLTQEKFSERIGIKRNTIANYETGRNEPIDAVVSLICREFNINEKWLRTGDGDMFSPPANETELIDGTSRKRMVTAILKMTTQECDTLERLIGLLLENKNT